MMSAVFDSSLTSATPAGDFKSTAMEDLCRVSRSPVGGGVLPGTARSMRKTLAPASERSRPAKGPTLCEQQSSVTRMAS